MGRRGHDEAVEVIDRAIELGITFFGAADVYSADESEEILGESMAGRDRDAFVIAGKIRGAMGDHPTASVTWPIARTRRRSR